MMSHPLPLTIVQNCYVVPDLETACARFNRIYGIGPFIGGTPFTLENHFYRGVAAAPIKLRGVFVQSGDLNIELIELLSDGPSAFHDMFPMGSGGFHHVAIFSPDYGATRDQYAADGLAVASEFTTPFGAKICYIDARATLGHMIELYPENDIIRAMYAQARDAVAKWQGHPLILPWS